MRGATITSCPRPELTTASCCGRAGAECRRRGDRGTEPSGPGTRWRPPLWALASSGSSFYCSQPCLSLPCVCVAGTSLAPTLRSPPSDGSYQPGSGLVILKRPYTNTSWPSTVSCQPDLLPIPRSPQHPGLSNRITSRRDADTRSEPSYENEEPEDADEEDDYHNEGYLEVLPDDCPNSNSAPLSNSTPNLGSPGLRDSPSSMVWGEDYVNVSESTEVSLGK
ncbi:linker for activation of T-cells family member 1-like [Vombatus ursinus]|uniref:linker for activation of T-cells family member 1-like n=1 Tax=Vombatus ursinus TaxID=29139 RepID=UPI000FFCFC08|nr:linker for activation of T-cells family member 1-like [Vombatus ursinus]